MCYLNVCFVFVLAPCRYRDRREILPSPLPPFFVSFFRSFFLTLAVSREVRGNSVSTFVSGLGRWGEELYVRLLLPPQAAPSFLADISHPYPCVLPCFFLSLCGELRGWLLVFPGWLTVVWAWDVFCNPVVIIGNLCSLRPNFRHYTS